VQQQGTQDSQGRIAFRLRVGVTGHRTLADHDAVAGKVRQALEHCLNALKLSAATPVLFVGVSPLAPGADQVVADEVLKYKDSLVEAPLPLAEATYFHESFQDDEAAKQHYHELLASPRVWATRPLQATADVSPEEAFELIGRYVVDNCDVLLAVWDRQEQRGTGGTAGVVAYAEATNRTLLIIPTTEGAAIEPGTFNEDLLRVAELVDRYNGEQIDAADYAAALQSRHDEVATKAAQTGCDPVVVQQVSSWTAPHYVRADIVAKRFQSYYNWFYLGVFMSSALAVSFAAFQALFESEHPWMEIGRAHV
jgi:hypothetical protein